MSTLKDVYGKWQNDPKFREEFKKDPLLALQTRNFELSPADLQKAKKLFAGEELAKKISK